MYHKLGEDVKNQIIEKISKMLRERREIQVAVIFGGFTANKSFRDIDIAVYTEYQVPYNRVEEYQEQLARQIEKQVNIPVDIVVIDYAPPWLKVKALQGIILVEKQPALAARIKFKALQEVKDMKSKTRKTSQEPNTPPKYTSTSS